MIEVNLLPGAKRGKKSAGPSIDFAAIGASIAARVQDKFLAAAVVSALVSALIIAGMFLWQRRQSQQLDTAVAAAVADSTRFAAVLLDRAQAQARRDSTLIQLNIIRAIDEERFIWPHLMEEVSRALPPYTWLLSIQNLVQQGTNPPAAAPMPPPPPAGARAARTPLPEFPKDEIKVRLTGRTVDLQAATRFYRNLEDSPFLGGVQLLRSETVVVGTNEIKQFVLDVSYTRPDSTLLRRERLSMTPR